MLLCFYITVCKMEYVISGLMMLRLTWIVLWICKYLFWSIILQTWKIPQEVWLRLYVEIEILLWLQNHLLWSGLFRGGTWSGGVSYFVISVSMKLQLKIFFIVKLLLNPNACWCIWSNFGVFGKLLNGKLENFKTIFLHHRHKNEKIYQKDIINYQLE